MTTTEFSNEFDSLIRLYNSSNEELIKLTFDEYEKSVLLTKAQEEIVIELYTGRNSGQTSFEETEEQRRYLQSLVADATITPYTSNTNTVFGTNSASCKLPRDTMFITFESVKVDGNIASVYPTTQDELSKIVKNPFRGPSNNRVLRINSTNNTVELLYKGNTISDYSIKYIKKPSPIILMDLVNDLSINEKSEESECKLDSSLHRVILDRAVTMAIQSMYLK